jgi:asparagine synthase (glutamine-hydrolysing)
MLHLLGDSHQAIPALAESASCDVVFDGLLYNRAVLGNLLGHPSEPTINNSRLILNAYQRWGEGVLTKIKGIFALVIWDSKRDILLCARDALGVYPLFYAEAGSDLLFSTSIKALLRHPQVSSAVNQAALADHLRHRWPKLDETFFAGVSRIPPGHAMRVVNGDRKVYRYWDPAPPGAPVNWTGENETERFDQLLDQAVERYLALGPAAIYLSGGLDSVTVAAVATECSRRKSFSDPWALSLIFPEPECNEEIVQRGVANGLGLPHVLVPFCEAVKGKGLLLSALELSSQLSVPLLNTWLPAYTYLALEGKRRGCRVILTGNGGDEWLTVTPYYAADLLRAWNFAGLYRLLASTQRSYQASRLAMVHDLLWTFGARPLLAERWANSRLRVPVRKVLSRVLEQRRRQRMLQSTPDWFAPDPSLRFAIEHRMEQNISQPKSDGFYLREMRPSLDHVLIAWDMEETFEVGQQAGVRVLHPFWDAELVDLLYRTPPDLLNMGGRSKGLVRQSLARRFPGLGFKQQKKVTSTNFFRSLMLKEGMAAWQLMGGTRALAELGIVKKEALGSTIEQILVKKLSREAYRIWDVLNLEAWLRTRI